MFTSIRLAGGDWHWRLCQAGGKIVIDVGSYQHERECRDAVEALQKHAGRAETREARSAALLLI
jgi:uncharacterized protein YegP (UPF0339 family)